MKKLPSIYKQKIDKVITNNNTVYYCTSNNRNLEEKNVDVNKFIDDLFKEGGYIFNKALIIKTKNKIYDTAIIKKDNNSIFTLSEDLIMIDDIVSIKRK